MLTCFYFFLVVAGGGYIAFSFIVGEIFDFGEDVSQTIEGISGSIGDALGNLGDILDGIFGGAEAAGADVGEIETPEIGEIGVEHEVESAGPSPFSLRTVAMFAAGFGGGGIMGKGLGFSDPLSLAPAFGTGLASSVLMWLFLRFLYAEQATTSIQEPDYIGLIGRVSLSIPKGELGQVILTVKGQIKNMPARSEDGSPISAQTQVEVISLEGGMLIVKEVK